MRRLLLLGLLGALLLSLSGCAVMDELSLSASGVKPDLRLLSRPDYTEEALSGAPAPQEDPALRVDLWLDATQVMGGINPEEESMYPHSSKKYREGGFHYRYEDRTGLYEPLLRCMLASAEGSRVRLLRYGNERLTDDFLMRQHVAEKDASDDALRSIRRDMLTFAIDPLPTVFSGLSDEKMDDSFYALGSPMLSQLENLNPRLLENPGLSDRMQAALSEQLSYIADGDCISLTDDMDSPLLYALDNIDLTRLSVITCDPAAIRRLTAADDEGTPVELAARLMEERGVFDRGLTVGLYAFRLDYMGQMRTFGPLSLSEPIIWGRLGYSDRQKQSTGELVMPRTLLTLVIGSETDVAAFTQELNARMAAEPQLHELRGPQKGELTYTQNGETITQQPFAFAWEYTQIARPSIDCITQRTEAVFTCEPGSVHTGDGLPLVILTGAEDASITLSLPLAALPEGVTADMSLLGGVQTETEGTLVLSRTEENTGSFTPAAEEQSITLRDKVYVFAPEEITGSPVVCERVETSGGRLMITLSADASALRPGYWRVHLSADLTAGVLTWEKAAWIDDLSASITNLQIAEWEDFSALLSEHERKRENPSRGFTHAWGGADNDTYRGEPVPDLPPVMQALWLEDLTDQLASAADVERIPYLRYAFDVFVTGEGTERRDDR